MSDGNYAYAIQVVDLAGNVSSIGGTLAVTIDTTAPAAPTIVLDPSTGVGTHGDVTSNPRPIFSGTAEKGSNVQLVQSCSSTARRP